MYKARKMLCECIFRTCLLMVTCYKCYSGSFFDVPCMLKASAASLQILVDQGKKAPGELKIFSQCLRSTQIEQKPFTNVCVVQRIKLFQCFTSYTIAEKKAFSFPLSFAKNFTISISSDLTVSYCIALNEPISFLYRIAHHVS